MTNSKCYGQWKWYEEIANIKQWRYDINSEED